MLTNISRSEVNQKMKFGQLTGYDIRNIFLKNYTQNVMKKLFSDPLNENSAYPWIEHNLRFSTVCFYSMAS